MFTIDVDLCEKLKREANASQLLNTLISRHYKNKVLEGLSDDDIAEVKRLNAIRREAEEDLRAYGIT